MGHASAGAFHPAASTCVRHNLLPRKDEDGSAGIHAILDNEDARFALGSECLSLSRDSERIVVGTACETEQQPIVGNHVLLAFGRRPNTDGLRLDKAGVMTDARGYIAVDDQCRTSAEGVRALDLASKDN